MKSKLFRVLTSIVLLAIIGYASFILMIILSFSAQNFYATIVFITYIALFLWFILWSFKIFKSRTLLYIMLAIFGLCAASTLTKFGHESYINSIPTVDEQRLYLTEYEPFGDNTKAIFITDESTLKLHDSLPVLNGATALYPLYSAFVQAAYPEGEYPLYGSIVKGNTTPEAYNELMKGDVDLIFCAAPSQKQIDNAAEQGIVFNMIPIGREAFVFLINRDNPLDNITVEQIQDIYSGKIEKWKEIGGKNQDIIAYQRPEGSGSQTMLEKIMGDKPLISPPQNRMAGGMGEIINRTAAYKNFDNAIGYSFLFFATEMVKNDQIKLLKINGIYPNKNTVESGEYPFTGDFYAITTNKLTNPNVDKFIEWILSEQGQSIVEKTGYVSIKN